MRATTWLAFQSSSNPSIDSSETGDVSQRLPVPLACAGSPGPVVVGFVDVLPVVVVSVGEPDDVGTSVCGVVFACEPEPQPAKAANSAICLRIGPEHSRMGRSGNARVPRAGLDAMEGRPHLAATPMRMISLRRLLSKLTVLALSASPAAAATTP